MEFSACIIGRMATAVPCSSTPEKHQPVHGGPPVAPKCILAWALTERQCEIADALLVGQSNAEIAQAVGCREATVKRDLAKMYLMFGICFEQRRSRRLLLCLALAKNGYT